jgi:hypothetical protein
MATAKLKADLATLSKIQKQKPQSDKIDTNIKRIIKENHALFKRLAQ